MRRRRVEGVRFFFLYWKNGDSLEQRKKNKTFHCAQTHHKIDTKTLIFFFFFFTAPNGWLSNMSCVVYKRSRSSRRSGASITIKLHQSKHIELVARLPLDCARGFSHLPIVKAPRYEGWKILYSFHPYFFFFFFACSKARYASASHYTQQDRLMLYPGPPPPP